jgi:hypothetical protein
MFFIARATAPIFPGWEVSMRTKRIGRGVICGKLERGALVL